MANFQAQIDNVVGNIMQATQMFKLVQNTSKTPTAEPQSAPQPDQSQAVQGASAAIEAQKMARARAQTEQRVKTRAASKIIPKNYLQELKERFDDADLKHI